MTALQSLHPAAQARHIVVDDSQSLSRISAGLVRGRNDVTRVLGEEIEPPVETPLIQQRRLAHDKIFHLALQKQLGDLFIETIVASRRHMSSPR